MSSNPTYNSALFHRRNSFFPTSAISVATSKWQEWKAGIRETAPVRIIGFYQRANEANNLPGRENELPPRIMAQCGGFSNRNFVCPQLLLARGWLENWARYRSIQVRWILMGKVCCWVADPKEPGKDKKRNYPADPTSVALQNWGLKLSCVFTVLPEGNRELMVEYWSLNAPLVPKNENMRCV